MPKVSIGLPVRNGERYLQASLEAICAQTFSDFDVLISDNASTDRTREIAEAMCSSDRRFSYQRQDQNLGAAGNFNYVFLHTRGEYFRWASHDDLVRPNYLSACLSALETGSKQSVLAYPQTIIIDADGKELECYSMATRKGRLTPSARLGALIGPGDDRRSLIHMCYPVFGLIRRSALEGTSLIANMPRSDNLLLVQLALKGPFIEVNEDLFLRRKHDEGSVVAAERAGGQGPKIERILAAWYDPKRGERFPATVTRLGLGYLRAVLRTPMSADEKIKALRIVAGWIARHGRVIGGEIKIVMREQLGVAA